MREQQANKLINKPMIFSINDGSRTTGTITELRKCDVGTFAMIKSDSIFKTGWYKIDTIISCVPSFTIQKKKRTQSKSKKNVQSKNEQYWSLINNIVESRNEIAESEKYIEDCMDEDRITNEKAYIQSQNRLAHNVFLTLNDMGYSDEEIEFDVGHY